MLPVVACNDLLNGTRAYTVTLAEHAARHYPRNVLRSNLPDLFLSKLRLSVSFSPCQPFGRVLRKMLLAPGELFGVDASTVFIAEVRPTLCNHIRRIIRRRAKEKMIGIDASGIIAVVAGTHTWWDRATRQRPR